MTLKDQVRNPIAGDNASRTTSKSAGNAKPKPQLESRVPSKKAAAVGQRTVGLIGLGAMGMGVARNLISKGFLVYACDTQPKVLAEVAKLGAITSPHAADIAPHVDVLLILVVNAEQTETVLFGKQGAAAALRPGSTVVASSTMPPAYAEALGERLLAIGLRCIDAPVSGGAVGANAGTMTIMASGAPSAFARADDVFKAISSRVYRLGDTPGMGSKVKMINQLLAGVHIASAAEAMALGIRAGIDPEQLFDVISNSAGSSWMFQNRVPHILAGDYTPHSAVDIFVKDLGIVLDSARQMKFPLPLTASAHQMFLATSAAGLGREDDSAVIKMFEKLAGITLPKARKRIIKEGGTTREAGKGGEAKTSRSADIKPVKKPASGKAGEVKAGESKTAEITATVKTAAERHASRKAARQIISTASKSSAAARKNPPGKS